MIDGIDGVAVGHWTDADARTAIRIDVRPGAGAERPVLAETAKLHEGDPENRGLWERFMPVCLAEIDRIFWETKKA